MQPADEYLRPYRATRSDYSYQPDDPYGAPDDKPGETSLLDHGQRTFGEEERYARYGQDVITSSTNRASELPHSLQHEDWQIQHAPITELNAAGPSSGSSDNFDIFTFLLIIFLFALVVQAARKHKRFLLRTASRTSLLREPALRLLRMMPQTVSDGILSELQWVDEGREAQPDTASSFESHSDDEEDQEETETAEKRRKGKRRQAGACSLPSEHRNRSRRDREVNGEDEETQSSDNSEEAICSGDEDEEQASRHMSDPVDMATTNEFTSCMSRLEGVLAEGGVLTLEDLDFAKKTLSTRGKVNAHGEFVSVLPPPRRLATDDAMTTVGLTVQHVPSQQQIQQKKHDEEVRWAKLDQALTLKRNANAWRAERESGEIKSAARKRVEPDLMVMSNELDGFESASIDEKIEKCQWLIEHALTQHPPHSLSKRKLAQELNAARRIRFSSAALHALRRLQSLYTLEGNAGAVIGADRAVLAEQISRYAFNLITGFSRVPRSEVKPSPMFAASYDNDVEVGVSKSILAESDEEDIEDAD